MEIKNPLALSSGSILMTSPYNTDTVLIAEKKTESHKQTSRTKPGLQKKDKKGGNPPGEKAD